MSMDFNSELHARPSVYFASPAYVEHIALMPSREFHQAPLHSVHSDQAEKDGLVRLVVERHTEFVTVTRVSQVKNDVLDWPMSSWTNGDFANHADLDNPTFVCRIGILVMEAPATEISALLARFGFSDTVASSVGGGSARVFSDFRVGPEGMSRILLINDGLNEYRLGRMVRRLYEIETYRSMALLSLPEARRLGSELSRYDARLTELTNRNLTTHDTGHKDLLEDISLLSAQIISAAAETRNRFGATSAYAKIVEERIVELREAHLDGFQRFGVFVARRFRPAVRTCEATATRLDQLANATAHLIDLLQTRIQMEIEIQNSYQIKVMAERAATQVRIQRAVEGFSVIAISYYLLSLLKLVLEASDKAGYHWSPLLMLGAIPVVVGAVATAIWRVRHAISATD